MNKSPDTQRSYRYRYLVVVGWGGKDAASCQEGGIRGVGARFACGVGDDGGRGLSPDSRSDTDASRCSKAVKPDGNADAARLQQLDRQTWLVDDRPA